MERNGRTKRWTALVLVLVLLLALAACGRQDAPAPETKEDEGPSDTLKGIYEALTAPDSDYSRNKAEMIEYYPELEYTETLGTDRITLGFKANGNEYFTDGSWEFVQEGDRLTATFPDDDYTGVINVILMADAIGGYFGMDSEIIGGYLNGLGALEIESGNFTMTDDETAKTTTCSLNIAGPWDMKELDQMTLTEAVLDTETLGNDYTSQGGSIGKIRYMANGTADSYTVMIAEYGGLDDLAYRSIVNLVTLRRPAGYEAFLADFTELKDLETDGYSVSLEPDDASVEEMMGERSGKFGYALLRFGSEDDGEEEYVVCVPDADVFADSYFRAVAGIPDAASGASLALAQTACGVAAFAADSELWLADEDTLKTNMLDAWESLTDDERSAFDAQFAQLNDLLNGCFQDWEANRGLFEDAGAAETMDELMQDGTSQWSWEALSAHTWTLGNGE